MIRTAKVGDLEELMEYGEVFWQSSPYHALDYNSDAVKDLCISLATEHYLRVAEEKGEIVGFIGIAVAPLHFNPNYVVGTELFFYVDPQYRGTVGRELFEQAQEDLKGIVDILAFGDMTTSKNMAKYYEHNGFKHTESSYAKVLI